MVHFNQVKEKIVSLIMTQSASNKYYIIRDVFGRISIYVQGNINIDELKRKIIELIGDEWVNLVTEINENNFIYKDILESTKQVSENVYYGERPLVKKAWRSLKKVDLGINSKVVTFYSYKGGVGRTTTLVLSALQLARQGKKVVIVDFDLEAPGVATILRPDNNEYPLYGIIDFLIESTKYDEKMDIDEYIYPITSKRLMGLSGGELYVMQASNTVNIDCEEYFEKLSRIDLGVPQYEKENNPVEILLKNIDSRYDPDFIFLDSRAGIHDIGGIALTKYTDNVVLVFYGNEQNMFGLNFILPRVVQQSLPFYLINSPVPLSEEEADEERNIFIKNSYETLINCKYYDENTLPDIYDESADHYPLDIKYNPEATLINNESRIDNLLNIEGSNNIYYKIADGLSLSINSTPINNIQFDKKLILEAIEKIIPSETAAAENEFKNKEDLKRKFYPLKEYRYIFENNKFLIVGPKGSGKTALFSVLRHPEYAKELAKYLRVPMQDINRSEWVTGLGLGQEFPHQDNFDAVGREDNLKLFRTYWQCLAIKSLKFYIEKYITDIPDLIRMIFECKFSEIKTIIDDSDNISEVISDLLSEVDSGLVKKDRVVIITYDALDFALNREYRGKMIAALIGLWFENITRFKNLKAKIFLREDIFKFEVQEGITDKVKLKNYTANLGWQYDYLLAMVWKRIVENNEDVATKFKEILRSNGYDLPKVEGLIGFVPVPNVDANKIILREIIGEKMGKGNKAYTYNWILYRMADTIQNIVPRSILKLFSTSAKNENGDNNRMLNSNEPILRPKSLENSLKDVSEDRLSDLSEEYPEYKNIFDNLKNYCINFPANEDNFREALIKCGIEDDRIKTVIDELKEIGILKEYQRKKSDAIRYHIPDIYLKGMELIRKGYR